MGFIKFGAFVFGLGDFAIVTGLAVLAINSPSSLNAAVLGISAAALAPVGFELCRFGFPSGEYKFFSNGLSGYILDSLTMLLAICLVAATVNSQHISRLLCDGRLSAGFPAAFICDASGESPLSSVGKIDWADLDSINLPGAFVDVLFFMSLLWIARLAVPRFSKMAGKGTQSQ